jgi:hypothetical protein
VISPDIARALDDITEALGDLLRDCVFVGGAVTGFLVTDPAAAPPRLTKDVDLVFDFVSYADHVQLSARLRAAGFAEDPTDGVICRWRIRGHRVDIMPMRTPNVFGFSNRWYPEAVVGAHTIGLDSGRTIRVVTAVHFVATKLEAFDGGKRGDMWSSHDLEDVIAVVDGRGTIVEEMARSSGPAIDYVRGRLASLLTDAEFSDAVRGHLTADESGGRRAPVVLRRLRAIAGVS